MDAIVTNIGPPKVREITSANGNSLRPKKRAIIEVENGISEKNLLEKIKEMNELQKFLIDKKIIKNIFVKDKLINLIVK